MQYVKQNKKWWQMNRKLRAILDLPMDNPIWKDKDFWSKKWPAMVDAKVQLLDDTVGAIPYAIR